MNKYRILEEKIKEHFKVNKQIVVLLGARQVGKTTLLKKLFPDALYLLVDEKSTIDSLETYSSDNYRKMIGNYQQILIDEIHLIENPGRAVKIIYDQLQGIQIIIIGSSSLRIKNKTAESMAGRAFDYFLYPLTWGEMLFQLGIEKETKLVSVLDKILRLDDQLTFKLYSIDNLVAEVLRYGLYPEIVQSKNKEDYLKNLAQKVIFKDIIELDLIDNRSKALELLKVLAYQIGNVINYAEISRKISLSIPTVQRYIDIFEQSFLLYRLFPFSKNKRDEIGKSPKIYFWDLGLRNGLIENFDNINLRQDRGAMFGNFIISEVKKELGYSGSNLKANYWRTKSGSEVDLILSNYKTLIGVEIKFKKGNFSLAFKNRYPDAKKIVINSENFFG